MYNEASVAGTVIEDLQRVFPIVVAVDDGSNDNSAAVARAAGAWVARHPTNLGAGAALQTGLEIALTLPNVEHILTFDADGQHLVEDAVAMVNAARSSGADVVIGSRFLGGSDAVPFLRRLVLKCAVKFTRSTSRLAVTDVHCGLRVFSTGAAEVIQLRIPGMAYASELVHIIKAHGLAFVEHPVTVRYTEYSRAKGQRNINAVNIAFDLLMRSLREAT